MKGMKNSGIEWLGVIPSSWRINPLYYYFSERKNKNILGKEDNLLSLSYGKIVRKNINTNEGLLPASFNTYNIVEPGDIIIRPTDLQNDKHSLRVGLVNEHGIITSAYIDLKSRRPINATYFYYLLYTYDVMKVFYNMGNGVRQGLNYSELSHLMLVEPPQNVQCIIVEYLNQKCSEIDSIIEDLKSSIKILEQYKQSIITEKVIKGLNTNTKMKDSGIEWIGEIPQGWQCLRIGGVYSLRAEKVSDKDFPPLSVTKKGIVPQLETAAKTNDGDNRKLVKDGDFVINSRSDRRGSCGISHYTGSVSLINNVLMPRKDVDSEYYNWVFQCSLFSDEFYRNGHGIVDDLWTTTWQDMKKIMIPAPSLSEQHAIAAYLNVKVSQIDSLIEDKNKQLAILDEYKKSLIFECVTGKTEIDYE